jgi:hypothetical protein
MFTYLLKSTPIYNNNLPSYDSMHMLALFSIKLNKPVNYNFFKYSINGKCKIKKNKNNDYIIFINNEKHSLPIINIYKHINIYIIITNNTIFPLSINTNCPYYINNIDTGFLKST